MTMENKPTGGAQRAMGLAELVNKVFTKERIPSSLEGHAGYRVEMAGPETLSTTARQGALDHLKLVPLDPARVGAGEGAGATLLIGTADPNLSQVELRTYERLEQLHRERYNGATLPIGVASYDALKKKIEDFFERQGITTVSSATRSEGGDARGGSDRAGEQRGRRSPVPALVVVGLIILGALLAVALRSR